MRLISNEEVLAVSGGAIQQVEVTGQSMKWWEKILYDLFGGGSGGYSNSEYNALQKAYVMANETGNPVTVELPSYSGTVGVESRGVTIEVSVDGAKYTATVEPADGHKR